MQSVVLASTPIATLRDGYIAGGVLLISLGTAAWVLTRPAGGEHYSEQLKYALLIAALGGTIGLASTAYLNAQAVTALLGLIVGYAAGARTSSRKTTKELKEPQEGSDEQETRDPDNR